MGFFKGWSRSVHRGVLGMMVMGLAWTAQTQAQGETRAFLDLAPAEQASILKGESVFTTQDVPGKPWPRAFYFQKVEASPEEAAAVFVDYDLHKAYLSKIKESRVSKVIDKRTVHVDYVLELPFPLSDESYTVENHLTNLGHELGYRIEWRMIRADQTQEIQGRIRFEPLGTGTLLAYENFCVPGSSIAAAAKKKAMEQMKATGKGIGSQILKERSQDRELLARQLEALRSALSE